MTTIHPGLVHSPTKRRRRVVERRCAPLPPCGSPASSGLKPRRGATRWLAAERRLRPSVHVQLAGKTFSVVGTDGTVDTQRVSERRRAGLAAQTTASAHGNPIGMRWVYELLAPGQLSLTDESGRSPDFQRCRDPIPASATPAEFLRGLFGIYLDDADAYLPFASDAGLRAFLAPDLVDQMARYFARSKAGEQVGTDCLSAEPITGATSDYKVTDVAVTVDSPAPATPDRKTGTVSFKNYGRPAVARFDQRRTSDGWRIDDLRAGTKPSLRARIAPCAASGK